MPSIFGALGNNGHVLLSTPEADLRLNKEGVEI
jgi:hypothetical protein